MGRVTLNVCTVRLTVAGIRYTVRAAPPGTPGADARALAVLRAGAARQDAWGDLCRFVTAQFGRPVAPAELEDALTLLGRRGRISVTREPKMAMAVPAAAANSNRPISVRSPWAEAAPMPTTLRVINDAGQSFGGQWVSVLAENQEPAQQRLVAGALVVDREGATVRWQLSRIGRAR